MSRLVTVQPSAAYISKEERVAKLQSAKKKLRKYRSSQASTSTPTSTSVPASATSRPIHAPAAIQPLSTDLSNLPQSRIPSVGLKEGTMFGKDVGEDKSAKGSVGVQGHAKQASVGARHRRQGSVAKSQGRGQLGGFAPAGWSMPNTASTSTSGSASMAPPSLFPPVPNDIINTPAAPLADDLTLDPFAGPPLPPVSHGEENADATRQRFTSFSFGAKPRSGISSVVSPQPSPARNRRSGVPLFPSQSAIPTLSSSISSPASLSSTELASSSRPPSLLFTAATPLRSSSTAGHLDQPSSPPAERRKRHSHTRSSSISLPNLKLGRPVSLGIPTSPSYPTSPTSPALDAVANARKSAPIIGSRLKFEPSEAEKEKEESRRKALDKLNGSSPLASPMMDEPEAAISLPDLEDDGVDMAAARPLSGIYTSPTFSFGRPNSLTLPSLSSSISSTSSSNSPFSWSAGEKATGASERWSFGQPKEDAIAFGGDLSKRASMTGTLAVLAEEDEAAEEDDMSDQSEVKETRRSFATPMDVPMDIPVEESTLPSPTVQGPTPVRLRELHLVSSVSGSTPSRKLSSIDSSSSARAGSPTKSYGPIGRGRPRPLSGIIGSTSSTGTSTPPTSALITPTASTRVQRRQSRGSSISYKKDGSTSSTGSVPYPAHRWSISSRDVVSPPPMEESIQSPLSTTSTTAPEWRATRPCPRPTSLAGLGFEGLGAARVLSRVSEREEDADSPSSMDRTRSREDWRLESAHKPESYTFQSFSSGPSSGRRRSHEAMSEDAGWRDEVLEVQMERDALREDVSVWKERCAAVEEKLEEERKENGVLRDRVRKLGDWLLNVSNTAPTSSTSGPAEDSRLMRELQEQLFAVTSSLEQERKEKDLALNRVAELEREMTKLRFEARPYPSSTDDSAPTPDSPFVATAAATPTRSPFASTPNTGSPTPAAPVLPDNDQRMRIWGFPRGPVMGKKENKRESFFGLSRDLRGSPLGSMSLPRETEEAELGMMGVDLPPFAVAGGGVLEVTSGPGPAAEPSVRTGNMTDNGASSRRYQAGRWIDASTSISTTHRALIPGAVVSAQTPLSAAAKVAAVDRSPGKAGETHSQVAVLDRAYEPPWKADHPSGRIPWFARGSSGMAPAMGVGLDMRAACRCCKGDVLEF